jgi:solute carrier family 25 folate transporter 32
MNSELRAFMASLLAGAGAGVMCTTLCAPLDVAKVRTQVQGSVAPLKYKGMTHTLSKIYYEEGLSGLYKGLGPALCTVPLFWGIYWTSYERLKVHYASEYPGASSHVHHVGAAVTAGAIGDVITNPFWVVRTRIQTLILHTQSHLPANIGMVQMFKEIYHKEGVRAFYKGLSASFLGLTHVAVQFPLYEYLKKRCRDMRGGGDESAVEIVAVSMMAKLTASLLTYPHEVVRSRLQDQRADQAAGIVQTVRTILRQEGVMSLWSGLAFNMIRVVPATISTFLSYEYLSRALREGDAPPHRLA